MMRKTGRLSGTFFLGFRVWWWVGAEGKLVEMEKVEEEKKLGFSGEEIEAYMGVLFVEFLRFEGWSSDY